MRAQRVFTLVLFISCGTHVCYLYCEDIHISTANHFSVSITDFIPHCAKENGPLRMQACVCIHMHEHKVCVNGHRRPTQFVVLQANYVVHILFHLYSRDFNHRRCVQFVYEMLRKTKQHTTFQATLLPTEPPRQLRWLGQITHTNQRKATKACTSTKPDKQVNSKVNEGINNLTAAFWTSFMGQVLPCIPTYTTRYRKRNGCNAVKGRSFNTHEQTPVDGVVSQKPCWHELGILELRDSDPCMVLLYTPYSYLMHVHVYISMYMFRACKQLYLCASTACSDMQQQQMMLWHAYSH